MKSFRLSKYIDLLLTFLHDRISPLDFERSYLDLYLNDETEWSEAEFAVLDELFGDVDAFCADPKLRGQNDLDEEQLRLKCKTTLGKLRRLQTHKLPAKKKFSHSENERKVLKWLKSNH